MTNKTQRTWVVEKLEDQGYITRNQCLQNFISRLGAIVLDLRKSGWVILAGYQKTPNGVDYCYTLVSKPAPKGLFDLPEVQNTKKLEQDKLKFL